MHTKRKIAFPHSAVEMDVRLWTFHGHRLMTHAPGELAGVTMPGQFCVSEETTGLRLPNCWGMTEKEADESAMQLLVAKGDQMPALLKQYPVLNSPCHHEELDMEGVCKSCGLGGAPSRW